MTTLLPDETILGLLAEQPRHGYQLLEVFESPAHLGAVWKASTSQLYAVLKRLERQGWISGQRVASVTAPTRTVYQLAAPGRAALESWLQEPHPSASIRRVRVEFLSRLYIARLLAMPVEGIIERQRLACGRALAQLQNEYQQLEPGMAQLAKAMLIAQLEAVLTWIESVYSLPDPSVKVEGAIE
jgi:DNA-binding PadR family transcriptional regulator